MSFTIAQLLPQNPTGATGGQIIAAYKASRFASPTVAPATNTAAPGNGPGGAGDTSPDGGPETTGANDIGGLITVPTFEPYMVSYYDPADTDPANGNGGTPNLFWLGPVEPVPPTTLNPYTDASGGGGFATTLTHQLGGGAALPTASIQVDSTANFPSAGFLLIQIGAGGGGTWTVVSYTSKDATHFLGCSGGVGTISIGQPVIVAYQNGPRRRDVDVSFDTTVNASGDTGAAQGYATTDGAIRYGGQAGIWNWTIAGTLSLTTSVPTLRVDPYGYYGFLKTVSGGGSCSVNRWTQTDL